ncbi:MAG: hypothetical protein JXR26_01665 [Balneolaceae bacterium]|nr:hypothetical protein [Balneolaceae bacterium]
MTKTNKLKNYFLWTLISALSAGALLGIFIFLFGEFGDLEIRLLVTTLAIGGFSLTGLCCSTIYKYDKLKTFAALGMATSVFGFIINLTGIWELWDTDSTVRFMATFIILSISFAHISLLLLLSPAKRLIQNIQKATITTIGIVGAMLVVAVFNEFENSEFYFRILGVFAILDVLGTILMPILNKTLSQDD